MLKQLSNINVKSPELQSYFMRPKWTAEQSEAVHEGLIKQDFIESKLMFVILVKIPLSYWVIEYISISMDSMIHWNIILSLLRSYTVCLSSLVETVGTFEFQPMGPQMQICVKWCIVLFSVILTRIYELLCMRCLNHSTATSGGKNCYY